GHFLPPTRRMRYRLRLDASSSAIAMPAPDTDIMSRLQAKARAGRKPRDGRPSFNPDDLRMPLGEHIEELRKVLIRCIYGLVVALGIGIYFGKDIVAWMAQPLLQIMSRLGYPPQLYTMDSTAGFGVYLRVVLVSSVIFASPWIIYQA